MSQFTSAIKRSLLYVEAASSLRRVVTKSRECVKWSPQVGSTICKCLMEKFSLNESNAGM